MGLFAANNHVTRGQWQRYVQGLQLSTDYPGMLGYGYATLIHHDQKARHVAALRAEGFSDYEINPPGDRPYYTSIIYLEPFNSRNQRAFGFDMFTETTRRAAMEDARDSGEASLSGPVTLVQENASDLQPGFLIYLPVYQQAPHSLSERREYLLGYVYGPFRAQDMIQSILRHDPKATLIDLEIFDGEAPSVATLLYDNHPEKLETVAAVRSARFSRQEVLSAAHHSWTLH
ncbi:MAG: CHASE domain-containing protein [Gammaproteobacteria bacterium]|nr:CHASE domain-containing protein [Gammaproteobacteria bacterium]